MKHKLLKSCTVVVLAALLLALPLAGFAASKKSGKSSSEAEKVQAPVRETNPNAGRAKYVFLFITDSASAATAIATGNKTLNGVINMDVTKSRKFTTIAETAKANGMKVGIAEILHTVVGSFGLVAEGFRDFRNARK